jgi:transcriptional regulator with XRE-family HTH domain
MKNAERLDIFPDKVKVKSLGERLRTVRKKLKWNQGQLAEYVGVKSKSTVSQYEDNKRKIPEDIKEWIERVENMFDHQNKKEVRKTVSDMPFLRKPPQEKFTKSAELMSGA